MCILNLPFKWLPIVAALTFCLQLRAAESLKSLTPFLSKHCFECRGAKKQKGDIRLDTLGRDLSDHGNLEDKSTRRHTYNSVPVIILGKEHRQVASRIRDLSDIYPALLRYLPR